MVSFNLLAAAATAFMGISKVSAAALPEDAEDASNLEKRDSWGGALSLGPSTSTIIKAETVIIPGTAPSTQNGQLFLWPGMSNGTGDLIQSTLESWPDNSWCGATKGQWCVRASIFGSFGQLDGAAAPVSGDQKIKISYVLQSDNNTWLQKVTDVATGKVLSTYSYKSGPYMRGWGTGTECDSSCTPTIAKQQYIDTTITLSAADTNFGKTLSVSGGTTYTGLKSSQGGKVWTIASINVPSMT